MDEENFVLLYNVRKLLEGTDIPYEDGIHVLYVNAAVNDGSDVAKLMAYFKTTEPDDMRQGALSKRGHFLKKEKGGYGDMCEISEKWYREIKTAGKKDGFEEGFKEGFKYNVPIDVDTLRRREPSLWTL